jgi:hypothetical protein
VPWEKELHQWASAKAKSFTLNAGAAEDELTTCAINIVEHAVTENKKPCDTTVGCARLFKELESSKINFYYF